MRNCLRSRTSGLVTIPGLPWAFLSLLLGLSLAAYPARAEDWPKFGKDLGNSAHSSEFTISSANVASLQSKWTFPTGGEISTTPAVVTLNGRHVLFVGAWTGIFYALDAITGQQIWTFTVDYVGGRCVQSTPWCRIGSSPAVDVAANRVFFGSYSGYLYALNATTGQLVWKAQVGDSLAGYEVWTSPSVYAGKVFVGVSSHGDDPCLPGGSVNAYDEVSGQSAWNFNTIDQSTCPGGGVCVGGSIWSSLAIDDVNGIVYAGTGNPGSSCVPPTQNAGLYPDSILALNASTGKLLNYFQAIADDTHDKDFGASPVLHASGIANQCSAFSTRPGIQYWVTEGSKNGYIYTLGRDANGLTGSSQQSFTNIVGFIATSGVLPLQLTKNCDSSGHKIINYTNLLFAPGSAGALWVLQQTGTGQVTIKKSTSVSDKFYGAPAIIDDVVLMGAGNGNLYISDYNGNVLKSIAIGSPVYGGISISNGRVYFGDKDGTIHCLSPNGS